MGRAFMIGVFTALLVAVVAAIALSTGALDLTKPNEVPDRILVIGVGPDSEGADVAVFAFVLHRSGKAPVVLDTMDEVTVAGTSARTPREAFPYVGEGGTAKNLERQTGGTALEWVALPAEVWTALADDAGGVDFTVDKDISAYADGSLVVLESGRQRLRGDELLAVASSVDYLDDGVRFDTLKRLGEALASEVSVRPSVLYSAVENDGASTSLSPQHLKTFTGGL